MLRSKVDAHYSTSASYTYFMIVCSYYATQEKPCYGENSQIKWLTVVRALMIARDLEHRHTIRYFTHPLSVGAINS
jgi:hypothetical protein